MWDIAVIVLLFAAFASGKSALKVILGGLIVITALRLMIAGQ